MKLVDEINTVLIDEAKKKNSMLQVLQNINKTLKGVSYANTPKEDRPSMLKELNSINKTVQDLILEFVKQ